MKKILLLFIQILLLCTLSSCDNRSDNQKKIDSIKVPQCPLVLVSEDSLYGTMTITSFEIVDYEMSSGLLDKENTFMYLKVKFLVYVENSKMNCCKFYVGAYNNDNVRIDTAYIYEKAINGETTQIEDYIYTDRECTKLTFYFE